MTAVADHAIARPTAATDSLARDWQLLLDSGARIAQLAGENATPAYPGHEAFEHLPPAIHALVKRQVADLLAILQPGLLTLETIAARKRDVGSAARALYREFACARDAIIQLVPEPA